jgi:hypothetical protein
VIVGLDSDTVLTLCPSWGLVVWRAWWVGGWAVGGSTTGCMCFTHDCACSISGIMPITRNMAVSKSNVILLCWSTNPARLVEPASTTHTAFLLPLPLPQGGAEAGGHT